ncbi:MAG: ABC transporter ATP-binding protein [Actinomycetaceae bacterium]|nr:ABC transporter ATP-binding protein [Actinomycetaceae bacterium]
MNDWMIEAHSLTAAFGAEKTGDFVRVLRGVDIDVPRGQMVAIVGPSGCGKTTLLYCLSGLGRPTGGRLMGFGRDMTTMSDSRLARLYRTKIGFVFQDSNLIGSLSALDNVMLPARLRHERPGPAKVRARELLARLGVGHRAGKLPAKLSTGEKQRVALARVLHQRPEVIFADEPTGALDSRSSSEVLDILRDYGRGQRSVVMVTHDVAAACQADIVLVMRDGVITHRLTGATPADVLAAMDEPAFEASQTQTEPRKGQPSCARPS